MDETKENKIIKVLSKLFNIKTFIILGSLLLMSSAFLGWIDQPVVGWLKGTEIQLSENLPPVISYGLLCFITGFLSITALLTRFRWISVITGAVGFLLSLNFILSFSIFDSKKIGAISDLNQQEKHIMLFNKYLPPNIGVEPTFDTSIAIDTIEERFYATLHFATFGWYAAIFGSLLLTIAFIKSGINKNIKNISLFLFISFILFYFSLTLFPYLRAEYHRNKGDNYLTIGMYSKAIDEYKLAKQLDDNIDYVKGFHNNLGKAYFFMGRNDKADYYIYRGNIFMQETDFPMAIFYFDRAKSIDPSISKTIGNNLISWAYVNYGLSEYRKGIVSSAIELWGKSLEADSLQIQPYYFLSRAYYDISAYEESIIAGLQFLKLSRDKIMKANVSSNIADSYYKLKIYSSAREYYLKSIFLDKDGNLRAIMSLIGR